MINVGTLYAAEGDIVKVLGNYILKTMQQGAECLWSGLLLHVTCGPHCTATANALTHPIHREYIHYLTLYTFTT